MSETDIPQDGPGPEESPEDTFLEMLYDERTEVKSLKAQGEEGCYLLRMCRVWSYVETVFADEARQKQEAVARALMSLAEEADAAIGDTPNRLTLLDIIEEKIGANHDGDVILATANALHKAGVRRFNDGVTNFLHAYHMMHALSLITLSTVQRYQTLARNSDVTRTISAGRQQSSHVLVQSPGWVSLLFKRSAYFSGVPDFVPGIHRKNPSPPTDNKQ